MSKYLTTPLYYPSANLHIGHAYTTLLVDAYKRYLKEMKEDVFFTTGSDEHGAKIEAIASSKGIKPKEFVDEIVFNFKELWSALKIDYDTFIRTTDLKHQQTVELVFNKMLANGDIYLGDYEGYYCIHDEAFFTKTQLVDMKCPDCHRDVVLKKEKSYFFNIKKYQDRLVKFYNDNVEFISNPGIKTEMLNNFINKGLEDLSVTRESVSWGIKVPNDPRQVIYVWLDALSGYLSALGYLNTDDNKFNKYWNESEIIHFIGKEISRFHVIYWPIFLMSLGLKLPKKVIIHGWIVIGEEKMSKSRGNMISPYVFIERYSLDSLRYFMLREMKVNDDLNFTPELFIERINSDLVNDLGNLLKRTLTMIGKYQDYQILESNCPNIDIDIELSNLRIETIKSYHQFMNEANISKALEVLFKYINFGNKYIEFYQPWVLFSSGESEVIKKVLFNLASILFDAAILLKPVLLELPGEIFNQLNIDIKYLNFEHLEMKQLLYGQKVNEAKVLITRLDTATEIKYLDSIIYPNGNKI